jgi:hypothetical protein
VSLADADGNELFAGVVSRTSPGVTGGSFQAVETTAALAQLRLDRSWVSTTADQVIADLCDAAGVGVVRSPVPGATLPVYTALREATALDHVLRLARASGMIVWTSGDGDLHIGPAAMVPGAVVLDRRQAIVRQSAGGQSAPDTVQVTGAGALGSGGPGAESWIVEDVSTIAAGPADAASWLGESALAMRADVERMQQAESARLRAESQPLQLVVAGAPGIDVNDGFTLMDETTTTLARCTGLAVAISACGLVTTLAAVPLAA